MSYYSARAYEYVRQKFNKNLPHLATIRAWYQNSNIDSSSGITKHSLNVLKQRSDQLKEKGKQLVCCLLFDEMHIKKHVQWNDHTGEFIGAADDIFEEDTVPIASQTLMFMVSGLNICFQLPVAYYMIHSITAQQKMDILIEIITEISKRGVEISSVCCDGLYLNSTMFEMLGANFNDLRPSFKNPFNGDDIHVIFDPCHMEKLVRNALGDRMIMFDKNNDKIKWDYLVKLEQFSRDNHLGLTHKINKRHIQYTDRIMHVRTAVQTLSNSTADSIEFLKDSGIPDFVDSNATIQFLRNINDLFDIMNTFRIKDLPDNQYKSAINPNNQEQVFIRLNELKEYILSLKMRMSDENRKIVPVLQSNRKTGFRGFIICIISVENIYRKYVEEKHWLLFFATYRISQDHLEIFFGKIRKSNGCNDNPTKQQLEAAYRKLEHQSDIMISDRANIEIIEEGTSISGNSNNVTSNNLEVSSRRKKKPQEDVEQIDDESEEHQQILDELIVSNREKNLANLTNDAGISFTSSLLENNLLTCKQIYCIHCKLMLESSEKLHEKECIGNNRPCKGTFKICKLTDIALKIYANEKTNIKNKATNYVKSKIDLNQLYDNNFPGEHDTNHILFIIDYFIKGFIQKAQNLSAKRSTLELREKFERQRTRKNLHFSGQ